MGLSPTPTIPWAGTFIPAVFKYFRVLFLSREFFIKTSSFISTLQIDLIAERLFEIVKISASLVGTNKSIWFVKI